MVRKAVYGVYICMYVQSCAYVMLKHTHVHVALTKECWYRACSYICAYIHMLAQGQICQLLAFVSVPDPFLHGMLTKFPYCLPGLINLLLCVFAAVCVSFLLPETLGAKKRYSPGNLSFIECAMQSGSS